jgi:hypothetical protein
VLSVGDVPCLLSQQAAACFGCDVQQTAQPVEKPLAEITKGNMSLIAERLILWERRGKSKQKGSYGEKAKG